MLYGQSFYPRIETSKTSGPSVRAKVGPPREAARSGERRETRDGTRTPTEGRMAPTRKPEQAAPRSGDGGREGEGARDRGAEGLRH